MGVLRAGTVREKREPWAPTSPSHPQTTGQRKKAYLTSLEATQPPHWGETQTFPPHYQKRGSSLVHDTFTASQEPHSPNQVLPSPLKPHPRPSGGAFIPPVLPNSQAKARVIAGTY